MREPSLASQLSTFSPCCRREERRDLYLLSLAFSLPPLTQLSVRFSHEEGGNVFLARFHFLLNFPMCQRAITGGPKTLLDKHYATERLFFTDQVASNSIDMSEFFSSTFHHYILHCGATSTKFGQPSFLSLKSASPITGKRQCCTAVHRPT